MEEAALAGEGQGGGDPRRNFVGESRDFGDTQRDERERVGLEVVGL